MRGEEAGASSLFDLWELEKRGRERRAPTQGRKGSGGKD